MMETQQQENGGGGSGCSRRRMEVTGVGESKIDFERMKEKTFPFTYPELEKKEDPYRIGYGRKRCRG